MKSTSCKVCGSTLRLADHAAVARHIVWHATVIADIDTVDEVNVLIDQVVDLDDVTLLNLDDWFGR